MTLAHPTSVPKRAFFDAIANRIWAASRPRIEQIVYANGGLGDELMLTAIARAAWQLGRPIHVLSALPDVWRGNRQIASLQADLDRWLYARRRGWISTDIIHLAYQTSRAGRHIAQQMADHLSIELPLEWKPALPAIKAGRRHSNRIVLQNSCRGARYNSPTKEWPQKEWQSLVPLLAGFELIQLGTTRDPALLGVRDLRGRTSFPQAALLIAESACFVGLESGLMHVAAAVATPAVIVYGGRTRPSQTGYRVHQHIAREPDCAGCALNEGCPHEMVCMQIPAVEVAAAIHRVLR